MNLSSRNTQTPERSRTGTCGYGSRNHTRPSDVPAGSLPSFLPARRTYSKCALALIGLSALPSLAIEAGQAATTLIAIPPRGVLSTHVGSLVSALGTWAALRGRAPRQRQSTRIEDQPIQNEAVPGHVTDPLCDAKHDAINGRLKDNLRDHENIFPRLAAVESRVSSLEGVVGEISKTNKSIDEKLTILLRRR